MSGERKEDDDGDLDDLGSDEEDGEDDGEGEEGERGDRGEESHGEGESGGGEQDDDLILQEGRSASPPEEEGDHDWLELNGRWYDGKRYTVKYQGGKKGQRASPVWDYFVCDTLDECTALCLICHERKRTGVAGGTKNLLNHMRQKHSNFWYVPEVPC
jgi:hypothetical protein